MLYHCPTSVLESANAKILWDFNIQTDKVIQARRPDIVVIDKETKTAVIIDVAVPSDRNVTAKEEEKTTKYEGLAVEMKRLWKVRQVPVIVGALGCVPKQQENI